MLEDLSNHGGVGEEGENDHGDGAAEAGKGVDEQASSKQLHPTLRVLLRGRQAPGPYRRGKRDTVLSGELRGSLRRSGVRGLL
jgi:hypothetical protein